MWWYSTAAWALPVFPGAEGFGTETIGGRSGRIVEVTSLEDDGPGTLRWALEDVEEPRIVVFKVAGTIELTDEIRLEEPDSYVTVAGQSAPGGGIALKNYGIDIREGAHDVVLRHLRIRPGDTTPGDTDKDGILIWGNSGSHVYNVVVDHVSISWATDENVNIYGWATDVTIQDSIIAEGALASDGSIGKGLLAAADTRITFTLARTLFANNNDRSPKASDMTEGVADIRHNVIYDWSGNNATKIEVGTRANLVGNLWIAGPHVTSDDIIFLEDDTTATHVEVWLADNRGPQCPEVCADAWDIGVFGPSGTVTEADHGADGPFAAPSVTPVSSEDLFDTILASAGATLPARDLADARIVDQVVTGTGTLDQGGDWPLLDPGTPVVDDDHDGMADDWEAAEGLDATDPDDHRGDLDGDGYTNVEEYLNQTTPTETDTSPDDSGTPSDSGEPTDSGDADDSGPSLDSGTGDGGAPGEDPAEGSPARDEPRATLGYSCSTTRPAIDGLVLATAALAMGLVRRRRSARAG